MKAWTRVARRARRSPGLALVLVTTIGACALAGAARADGLLPPVTVPPPAPPPPAITAPPASTTPTPPPVPTPSPPSSPAQPPPPPAPAQPAVSTATTTATSTAGSAASTVTGAATVPVVTSTKRAASTVDLSTKSVTRAVAGATGSVRASAEQGASSVGSSLGHAAAPVAGVAGEADSLRSTGTVLEQAAGGSGRGDRFASSLVQLPPEQARPGPGGTGADELAAGLASFRPDGLGARAGPLLGTARLTAAPASTPASDPARRHSGARAVLGLPRRGALAGGLVALVALAGLGLAALGRSLSSVGGCLAATGFPFPRFRVLPCPPTVSAQSKATVAPPLAGAASRGAPLLPPTGPAGGAGPHWGGGRPHPGHVRDAGIVSADHPADTLKTVALALLAAANAVLLLLRGRIASRTGG